MNGALATVGALRWDSDPRLPARLTRPLARGATALNPRRAISRTSMRDVERTR